MPSPPTLFCITIISLPRLVRCTRGSPIDLAILYFADRLIGDRNFADRNYLGEIYMTQSPATLRVLAATSLFPSSPTLFCITIVSLPRLVRCTRGSPIDHDLASLYFGDCLIGDRNFADRNCLGEIYNLNFTHFFKFSPINTFALCKPSYTSATEMSSTHSNTARDSLLTVIFFRQFGSTGCSSHSTQAGIRNSLQITKTIALEKRSVQGTDINRHDSTSVA